MSTAKRMSTRGEDLNPANVPRKGKKSRGRRRSYVLIGILVCVVLAGTASALFVYQTYSSRYHTDMALAQTGIQHLRKAESLLTAYPKNYLNNSPVSQAEQEFALSTRTFTQLNADLQALPGVSRSVPGYGTQLNAALQVLPIALDVSQSGSVACNALEAITGKLHNLAAGKTLSMADFSSIEQSFQQMKDAVNRVIDRLNHLPLDVLKVDPRLTTLMNTFRKEAPALQGWLNDATHFLPAAPTLLGLSSPANYLVEVLDSTELRPGGGFIGNYGIATVSGGRLKTADLTDTYLLDKPYVAAGHSIAFPPAYAWFPLSAEGWSLRDSNLDADFPTAAVDAEQIYKQEGGTVPVQGVVAITPALIQHALEIIGPISVPEYHETITAQNLIDRIHYYQLVANNHGAGFTPSSDGNSSVRKNFTALLGEHFLARVHQLSPSEISRFIQLFVDAFHTKDVQVYLNAAPAENLLHQLHLDDAIQQSSRDGFFVVDANIGDNKANAFITNTLTDGVSFDAQGNATHQTTLTYAWIRQGQVYGSATYQDYLRVYVPRGSVLRAQNGWQPRGTSTAFGCQVWAGFFTLAYGQTLTITFTWMVPGAAQKQAQGWQYQELIQRQAGTLWKLHVQVTVPVCKAITSMQGGLTPDTANRQVAALTHFLSEDTNLGVTYTC